MSAYLVVLQSSFDDFRAANIKRFLYVTAIVLDKRSTIDQNVDGRTGVVLEQAGGQLRAAD